MAFLKRLWAQTRLNLWEKPRGRAVLIALTGLALFCVFLLFRPFSGVAEDAHEARLFAQAQIIASLIVEESLREDAGRGELIANGSRGARQRSDFAVKKAANLLQRLRKPIGAQILLYDRQGRGLVDSDKVMRATQIRAQPIAPPGGGDGGAGDPAKEIKEQVQRAAVKAVLRGALPASRITVSGETFYVVGVPVQRLRVIRGVIVVISPELPTGEAILSLISLLGAILATICFGVFAVYALAAPLERAAPAPSSGGAGGGSPKKASA